MKLNTLKNRQDFLVMSQKGSKIATKGMVVECYLSSSEDEFSENKENNNKAKVGFTASKKVGKSVYRNKAKRRLKESVRHVMDKNPKLFKDGYNYNFIARYTTIERDFEGLVKDVKFALYNIENHKDDNKA